MTIPVAIQKAVGIGEGVEIVIRAEGPGVFVIETVEAVKERIRAAAAPPPPGEVYDAVVEVRALRDSERHNQLAADELPSLDTGAPLSGSPDPEPPDPGPDLLRRLFP
ncbi:hypothetical protein ACI1MP_37490 (plasmid) [Kitasatospora griseola]|uniref:hypothetical protein n=1 Tax=Kitasatospora griseola TaxID=2064 RepID=UPI0038556BCB